MGAAASPICSADCARRFDATRRLKPPGSEIAEGEGKTLAFVEDDIARLPLPISAARLADRLCDAYLWAWHESRAPLVARQFEFVEASAQGLRRACSKPNKLPRKRRSAAVGSGV
jgi:hypothetical protein